MFSTHATVALMLLVLVSSGCAERAQQSVAKPTLVVISTSVPTETDTTPRSGETKVDLGRSPDLGSQGQAKELLKLIEQNPGKAVYTITYSSPIDQTTVSCDLVQNTMTRTHGPPSSTKSVWRGYIIERLRNGAAGGSLNNTPAGNIPGSFDPL